MLNNKALATAVSASFLLSIFMLMYISFAAYGVPEYCKNAETRMMEDFLNEMALIQSELIEVIETGKGKGLELKYSYTYPTIPLFITPKTASVTQNTYDITVTISNVMSNEIEIPNTITLRGKGLRATLDMAFTPSITAHIENGILASDVTYLQGSVLRGDTILLPFFSGELYSNQLYPTSAGGEAIYIQNRNQNNITITISGSKIKQSAWAEFSNQTGLYVVYSNNTVTIHIPPGTYRLKTGVASFGGSSSNPAAYLKPMSSTTEKAPASLRVVVLDEYFNPTPQTVSVTCLQSCEIRYIDCTTSCENKTAQNTATLPRSAYPSVVVNPSNVGITTVIFSVSRPNMGQYQIPFLITKS